MDATVDTHQVPGITSRDQDSLLDGFTTTPNTVNHTISPHVITTPPEDINHAAPVNQLQNAKNHVLTELAMNQTNGMPKAFMVSHQTLKRFKPKS